MLSVVSNAELLLFTVAVIFGGTVGAVLHLFGYELGLAREAAQRGSFLVNTDAGPIEYAERGTGIPLLSIHGAGGGFDQGLTNAIEFAGENFRIIAPSRFGYLRTPVPEISLGGWPKRSRRQC